MKMLLVPALLAVTFIPSSATMLMKPYLQAVSTSSVVVMVECDSQAESVYVEYGLTSGYGKTAATKSILSPTAGSYVHRVQLSNLLPDTLYHYRTRQGSGTPSADFSFRTAVTPGTPYRFAWLADFRTNTNIHAQIAPLVQAANPRFSVYGGDLCATTTYDSYKSEFFLPQEQDLIARVPYFYVVGNHETYGSVTKAFAQNPTAQGISTGYYSFDYGDLHVVVLNTELPVSSGSQAAFLTSDLNATQKHWRLAVMHKPGYCAGGHGENPDVIAAVRNIMVPQGLDMTMAGDSHMYQHNLVDGVHHYIIGSVGAPLVAPATASYTIKSLMSYCYGIIDFNPVRLKLMVRNENGVPIDSLTLVKAYFVSADSASATKGRAFGFRCAYQKDPSLSASFVLLRKPSWISNQNDSLYGTPTSPGVDTVKAILRDAANKVYDSLTLAIRIADSVIGPRIVAIRSGQKSISSFQIAERASLLFSAQPGEFRVEAFNLAGRRVGEWRGKAPAKGPVRLPWPGPSARGVYWFVIEQHGYRSFEKGVLVR